jgi:O-acetyl-ADP-ribose deacetylase (regulator of RNase III)
VTDPSEVEGLALVVDASDGPEAWTRLVRCADFQELADVWALSKALGMFPVLGAGQLTLAAAAWESMEDYLADLDQRAWEPEGLAAEILAGAAPSWAAPFETLAELPGRLPADVAGRLAPRSEVCREVQRARGATFHVGVGDLLAAPLDLLVVPVNCRGVMGAGLAVQARDRWPGLEADLRDACGRGALRPGQLAISRPGADRLPLVALLATKDDWRDPSRLEWVARGLDALARELRGEGALASADVRLRSVGVPALGCGLGGLAWEDVRREIWNRLRTVPNVDVHVWRPR